MNHYYPLDNHALTTSSTNQSQPNFITVATYSNSSLQTDPDLYALKNKKRNETKSIKRDTHLVSNNRLAYVEALVDINAVVIESIWCLNTTTPNNSNGSNVSKESRVSPVVPLRTFIQEVLKRSRTTYSTLQTALFYLFRARPKIIEHSQQQQKSWQHNAYISCGRRMFLASLVVASKFVQDKTYRNSAWAKIAGLPVAEINTAERFFLSLMDYRLYIDQPTFDRWHRLLHIRTQARMHNIPTSLRDLTCLSFAPPSYPPPPSPVMTTCINYSNKPATSTINTAITQEYNNNNNLSNNLSSLESPSYSLPPALSLSLPSSISSSPAQTPTQISPLRTTTTTTTQKRKHDSRDYITIMDKKHCRFWQ